MLRVCRTKSGSQSNPFPKQRNCSPPQPPRWSPSYPPGHRVPPHHILRHTPSCHRTPRKISKVNERTLTPFLRLWDLRCQIALHDQHASHSLAGARTRRLACSHHGPGLHPFRPHEHGPRTSTTPAPLLRLRTLPPRYAHGQDGTTTHRHTPWAGTQIFYLSMRKGQALLPSKTLRSEWPDSNPFDPSIGEDGWPGQRCEQVRRRVHTSADFEVRRGDEDSRGVGVA